MDEKEGSAACLAVGTRLNGGGLVPWAFSP